MPERIILHVLLLLCSAGIICGDTCLNDFSPVKVSDGPLVYFTHSTAGISYSETDKVVPVQEAYICDPSTGIKVQLVRRSDSAPMIPLHRLTTNHIVIRFDQECYIWDLAGARAVPLWAGGDQTTFLKANGQKTYFLRRLKPYPFYPYSDSIRDRSTPGLHTPRNGFRPRDKLYTLTLGDIAGAVELTTAPLERVLETDPGGIWAVTSDDPRSICFISNEGTVFNLLPFAPHWAAAQAYAKFSGSGKYLALSIPHGSIDTGCTRELIVIDTTRRSIQSIIRYVDEARDAYPMPPVLNWVSETRLVFGRAKCARILDLRSGSTSPMTSVDWQLISQPAYQKAECGCLFDTRWGKTWFVDDTKQEDRSVDESGTIVSEMEFCANQQWAAYCDVGAREICLLEIPARRKHRLFPGWANGIKWLPAMETGQ